MVTLPPSPALLMADLTPASRSPHALAVRFSATRQRAPPRPSHPTPRFVTIASRPSCRGGTRETRFSESNIFRPRLEIPISLNPLTKLAFRRRRFCPVEDRTNEVNRGELIKLICPIGHSEIFLARGTGRRFRDLVPDTAFGGIADMTRLALAGLGANDTIRTSAQPRLLQLHLHNCEAFVRKLRACRIPNGSSRRASLR